MSKQNPSQIEMMRPLHEQDRIDSALGKMAIRLDKVLTESVVSQWHADLGSYPIAAIEYAADWCGKNLEKWPKWKQFAHALGTWMQEQEQSTGRDFTPSHKELMQGRRRFNEWYNSPDAAEVREMIRALDNKMNEGRPRLYTQKELDSFKLRKERQ
jgi:hypothetical protein